MPIKLRLLNFPFVLLWRRTTAPLRIVNLIMYVSSVRTFQVVLIYVCLMESISLHAGLRQYKMSLSDENEREKLWRCSLLICMRRERDLLENLGVCSGISPAKIVFTKRKKVTFSGGLQGQRLTAAITATPVGFYCSDWCCCWGITSPPGSLIFFQNKHITHMFRTVFQSLFSPSEYCDDRKRNLYNYLLLHSNHYQLDTLWGSPGPPPACTVSGAIF